VKGKVESVEKYSIDDIEPLILSILDKYENATEQWICTTLKYNEGYISQMRSREKRYNKPQVPVKFYNQLKNFGLHNATSTKPAQGDPLLREKEARRQDAERWAQLAREDKEKAEKEKDRLLTIIETNLSKLLEVSLKLSSNLNEVKEDTFLGLSYQRAWVEYTAEVAAKGDKKKKDQTVLHMGKLLKLQIAQGRKEDNRADAGKQSKDEN
jgi:hypothetical protein